MGIHVAMLLLPIRFVTLLLLAPCAVVASEFALLLATQCLPEQWPGPLPILLSSVMFGQHPTK
jgi:hypothetical protein